MAISTKKKGRGNSGEDHYNWGKKAVTRLDLSGKEINGVKIIGYSSTKDNRSHWYCLCRCGNYFETMGKSLKSGNTKSCGCSQKKHIGDFNRLKPGESAFNKIYNTYLARAIKKNLEFTISKEDFKKLTKQDCFYCGIEPLQESYANKNYNKTNYIYNGVDRIDNNLGYTENNSVPCCKHCNTMKMSLSVEDFLNRVKNIYERLILDGSNN